MHLKLIMYIIQLDTQHLERRQAMPYSGIVAGKVWQNDREEGP